MKPRFFLLAAGLVILGGCAVVDVAEVVSYKATNAAKEKTPFQVQKEAIYARMERYGINRDDVAALKRLYESVPPYSDPHTEVLAKHLLKPGEHYRIEMDEFILTMKVPDAPDSSSWLWPYTNTRTPDLAMEKYLQRKNGSLTVASLGWENCVSLGCMTSRGDVSGVTMTYRILKPEEITGKFSTPEKLQQGSRDNQKLLIEQALARRGKNPIVGDAELEARRVALAPEIVTINGRIWVRNAMNDYMGRDYVYVTTLSPGRMLSVRFGMPLGHDYNAQPNPATWPRSAKRAFENMELMAASLRIAKINDNGAPDPFVVERVEPAPLPVREKRPLD